MKFLNVLTIASLVIGFAAFAEESVNNTSVAPAVKQEATQSKKVAKHKKGKKAAKAKSAGSEQNAAVTPIKQ